MKPTDHERVTLNISGDVYETYRNTLKRFPKTLLGDGEKCLPYYCPATGAYFFDRNRSCFGAILHFYQSYGSLRCPPQISIPNFESECVFFELPPETIHNMKLDLGILSELDMEDENEIVEVTLRSQIWDFLENPDTSNGAKWFAIISLLLILVSILTVCLETVPALQSSQRFATNPWAMTELILNSWFLVELVVRLAFTPSRVGFLYDTLNWIDALAVIPYFITPLFSASKMKSLGFLRILKFVRVMRLFRLSKQSKRLKVVGAIIKSSLAGFQLLLLCLAIVVIFGGSIMYWIEKHTENTEFKSIPDSLWWGVQALTTVGYGDIVPTTFLGKLLSSGYMTFGALTISLSVLPIVSKFMLYYEKNIDTNPDD